MRSAALTDCFALLNILLGLGALVGLAVLAWVVFGRRIGILALSVALGLVFLIGTSRIYLGYHYFTDVIGGVAAGLVWILIVGGGFGGKCGFHYEAHVAARPRPRAVSARPKAKPTTAKAARKSAVKKAPKAKGKRRS